MYNGNQLEEFFKNVHKEASIAAQKVYDKYLKEAETRIKNQLYKGDSFYVGMGTGFVQDSKGSIKHHINHDFVSTIVDNTQYWSENMNAGFKLNTLISK